MNRLIIGLGILFGCALVAGLNLFITRTTGLYLFSLFIFFILPVGAIISGAVAGLGGVFAARMFNIIPNKIDAVSMTIGSALSMLLFYYLDYKTTSSSDGRFISEYVTFWQFMDYTLQSDSIFFDNDDVGKAGQFGGVLALLNLVGF